MEGYMPCSKNRTDCGRHAAEQRKSHREEQMDHLGIQAKKVALAEKSLGALVRGFAGHNEPRDGGHRGAVAAAVLIKRSCQDG